MSLAIDVDNVTNVLLSDGKWYGVKDNSFDVDAWEVGSHDKTRNEFRDFSNQSPCTSGATWDGDDSRRYAVPMSAIRGLMIGGLV